MELILYVPLTLLLVYFGVVGSWRLAAYVSHKIRQWNGALELWRQAAERYPASSDGQGASPFTEQMLRMPWTFFACTCRFTISQGGVRVKLLGPRFKRSPDNAPFFVPWQAMSQPRQVRLPTLFGLRQRYYEVDVQGIDAVLVINPRTWRKFFAPRFGDPDLRDSFLIRQWRQLARTYPPSPRSNRTRLDGRQFVRGTGEDSSFLWECVVWADDNCLHLRQAHAFFFLLRAARASIPRHCLSDPYEVDPGLAVCEGETWVAVAVEGVGVELLMTREAWDRRFGSKRGGAS